MRDDLTSPVERRTDFETVALKELVDLIGVAQRLEELALQMLNPIQKEPFVRALKYLACSVASAYSALVLLARNGHGAEAAVVGRGMFEAFVTYRYLILKPEEFQNFIDYDPVARWKRLELYRQHQPQVYESIPRERISFVEEQFNRVREKFTTRQGKLLDHWTRHSLFTLAQAVNEEAMYHVFYRYASSLSHSDPMGLTMLVGGKSFEIDLGPSTAHVDISIASGSYIMLRTLHQYNHLLNVGLDKVLGDIEADFDRIRVSAGGNPVGWFGETITAHNTGDTEKPQNDGPI